MNFLKFFLFIICLSAFANEKNLPAPYDSIEILPAKYFNGWFRNRKELKELIEKHKITTIVELGSWLGASAIFMAKQLPENGKIYCVDHWMGSIEHRNGHDIRSATLLPTLYQQFLSNVLHSKMEHKVIPIKASTAKAAESFNQQVEMIYVDAAHDEVNVYNDITNWYPKLAKGGIMCGDDWDAKSVNNAVVKFAKENKIKIFFTKAFWWYDYKK